MPSFNCKDCIDYYAEGCKSRDLKVCKEFRYAYQCLYFSICNGDCYCEREDNREDDLEERGCEYTKDFKACPHYHEYS